MYGMIQQAARDMVLARYGEEVWQAVLGESGLTSEHFISAQAYDDTITFSLLSAIGTLSDMHQDELLEEFGKFWIEFAEASPYSSVLRMAGDDLVTFLSNLDRMHASIKSTMPQTAVPSFQLLNANDGHIQLVYRSERQGLAPFVRGILHALLKKFGHTGDISTRPTDGAVVFDIVLHAAEAA